MAAEAEKAKLNISLLGPPVVAIHHNPLAISRRLTRALLYYLACQPQPASRMSLCNLFWPSSPEDLARKNLREQLSLLRKALGNESLVVTDMDQVSLDHSQVYVDSSKFIETVSQVHFNLEMMPTGKLPESLYHTLHDSLLLWRTPYFMQGFEMDNQGEYESWLFKTSQHVEYWRQNFAERLADHNISMGRLDEAIIWLNSALDADPLNTDLHYLVLTCLRDLGRKNEIIRYGGYLYQVYSVEHGEPVPQLLSDFLARLADSIFVSTRQENLAWPGLSSGRNQFVGRRDILQQLNLDLYQGGIAVIQGETGMGKSRLLEEFYNRLEVPVRLLYLSSGAMDSSTPFQTIIKGLKRGIAREEWNLFPSENVDLLENNFSDLFSLQSEGRSDYTGTFNSEAFQAIQDSLASIFLQIAQKRRLLIILDDAHWCDAASLSFFTFLNERGFFKSDGFLLIAAQIDEEKPYLDDFIFRNKTYRNVSQILLGTLTSDEIASLVYFITGKTFPEEATQRLARDSAGIPLIVLEMIKNLMETSVNLDEISTTEHFPIPATIQSLILERIQHADANTRTVLIAGALLGRRFAPDLVESVTQLSREAVVMSLEKLVKVHSIVAVPDLKPAGGYEFVYDNIRVALVDSLDPALKRMYALRSIDAIRAKYGATDAISDACARYYEIAGEIGLAFHEWVNAANYAVQQFLKKDAETAFQRALSLCMQNDSLFSDQDFYELFNLYADYTYDLEDSHNCEEIYRECMTLGEKRRSPLLIGTAFSGMARVSGMRGQISRGLTFTSSALQYLQEAGAEGEIIEVFTRQAILYNLGNDYRKSLECLEKAIAYPVSSNTVRASTALCDARSQLSMIYCLMGFPFKGEQQAQIACADARFLQSESARYKSKAMLSLATFHLGKYHTSVEAACSALQFTEPLQKNWWSALLTVTLARSYFLTGFLDEGWTMSEKALQYGSICEGQYWVSQALCTRGDFFRFLGDYSQAEEYYRKGMQESEEEFQMLENKYLLGYTMALNGNREGNTLIKQAMMAGRKMGLGSITIPASAVLLQLSVEKEGELPTNFRLRNQTAIAERGGFGLIQVLHQITWAEVLAAQSKKQRAEEQYQLAAARAREILNPWSELQIYYKVLSQKGFSDGFQQQARVRARSIFDFLAEHANTPPCKEKVEEYQYRWKNIL